MTMVKRLIAAFSAAAILTSAVNLGAFAGDDTICEEQVFAMVSEYSDSEYGYLPSKLIDENNNEVEQELMPHSYGNLAANLPEKYSSIDYGYVPVIRNQGSEGTCWAHAGLALAETNMVKNGLAAVDSVNFSEKHLAWFASGVNPDPSDPIYGDITPLGTSIYSVGGNSNDFSLTLFAWMGVEQESIVPYENFTVGVDEEYRYDSYGHLQNMNRYDAADTVSIKNAIMNDGAVSVAFYADTNYVTRSNEAGFAAYYRPGSSGTNHEVAIVGWDDNFSRNNFLNGTPSVDGAWLCRNSWGEYWGTGGYFYLSYDEPELGDFSSLRVEAPTNYGSVYQRDGGAFHNTSNNLIYSYWYYQSTGYTGAANIFTAKADEKLAAVSFYTPMANINYRIEIYNNIADEKISTYTPVCSQSGTETYSGYHTVKLNEEIELTAGNKFAVLVDLWDESGNHYLVTDAYNGAAGNSVYIFNGNTRDFINKSTPGNPRIKAYTTYTSEADPVDPIETTAPQNVRATAGDKSAYIEWDAVSGASSYRVMVNDGTTWKGCNTTATSYTVSNLTNGIQYAFAVKAIIDDAYGDTSEVVYATPFTLVPQNVRATAGESCVTVQWDAVADASSYRVMVNDGTGWKGFNTTATSYTATNLTGGTEYAFAVKANVGGVYGGTSNVVYATPFTLVPQNVRATAGDSKVTVQWDAVSDADSYRVMVYDGNAWKGYNTTETSYTVSSLVNDKQYAFAVKANVNGAYSGTSAVVYATPFSCIPQNVIATVEDSSVFVEWDSVADASYYRVMINDGSTWKGYNTTATYYTAANLISGKQYAFAVKAYVNGVYSDISTIVYATPFTIVPQNVKASAGDSKVLVKWDEVAGASSYRVMVYNGSTWSGYNTTSTSYMVRNLTNGKKYAFAVKAYVDGAYSGASPAVYATPTL